MGILRKFGIGIFALTILLSGFSKSILAGESIKLGVLPLEEKKIMFKQFMPLAMYLKKETGINIKLVIAKSYQDAMDILGNNKVQICYLTPTTYPKAERQNPDAKIVPLVRFLKKGKGTYRSCLIIPANSTIAEIAKLKGKKVAFGNANSTSSHLMPRSMLIGGGLDIEKDFVEIKHLKSHSDVAEAVALGKFDVGGVKESVANKYSKSGKVKILKTSGDIPQFPFCVNKHLSDDSLAKIKAALLKLNDGSENSKKVLKAINPKFTGTEETTSKDYDIIRDMVLKLYGEKFYNR